MRSVLTVGAGVAVLTVVGGTLLLAVTAVDPGPPIGLAAKFIAAELAAVAAGYVTAKASDRRPVVHGAVLAGLILLLGLPGLLTGRLGDPGWATTGMFLAAAPLAAAGAWVGRPRSARRA